MPPEEDDEDIFGYGDDLGEAAYLPDTAVPEQGGKAGDREQPPQPKRARTTTPGSVALIVASLDGLEARLTACGEEPHFVQSQPGLLRHTCSTADASVCFWPGSLKWCVDGPQAALMDAALLAPHTDASPAGTFHAAAS